LPLIPNGPFRGTTSDSKTSIAGRGASALVDEDATIVISHVGPSTIEGTFIGVVEAAGYPAVIITDGEFTVRRDNDLQLPCRT
jgi:hypothetical protein